MSLALAFVHAKWIIPLTLLVALAFVAWRNLNGRAERMRLLVGELAKLHAERRALGLELVSARAEVASLRQTLQREQLQSRIAIEALLTVSGPSDDVLARVDRFLRGAGGNVQTARGAETDDEMVPSPGNKSLVA
jgi:hypothetical protein